MKQNGDAPTLKTNDKLVSLATGSLRNPNQAVTTADLLPLQLENGRYGHATKWSDTSIRVDTTADTNTDTSTLCVGVPATYIIKPGKVTWRMQLIRNGWHMQTISNKQTCALSQFYDWLIRRNVRVIDSWLLLSLPAGGGSAAWWWPRPVLRRLCNLIPASPWHSLLPPPSPPTLSRIMDHKTALTSARGGRVTGRLNALWSSCNVTCQQLMNLQ